MPTPVQAFAEVAARHGGVDPSDLEAVQRFYAETLRTLEPPAILGILEELLEREGRTGDPCPDASYPTGAALPSVHGSASVPLPLLARGWRRALDGLLRRRVKKP